MDESDKVMEQVNKVTSDYQPLARYCSSIFFVLTDMNSIHYLYEYSLSFFMEVFNELISSNEELVKIPKNELE